MDKNASPKGNESPETSPEAPFTSTGIQGSTGGSRLPYKLGP